MRPTVDQCQGMLVAMGFSIGEAAFRRPDGSLLWQVDAARDDQVVLAHGATQTQAWQLAVRCAGRLLRALALVVVVLAAGCRAEVPAAVAPSAPPLTGKVVKVADGDTVTVLLGREQIRVRLWGIDAPERGQPFGNRAKKLAVELAFGQVVTVEPVEEDRYGRTVARVILPDGRDLGQAIVAAGLAWWYRRYAPGDKQLERLEAEARAAKRGLWVEPNPVAPWEWRAREREKQPARAP